MKISRRKRMIISLIVAIGSIVIHETLLKKPSLRSDQRKMIEARELARVWMEIIDDQKRALGLESDLVTTIAHNGMLGAEFTPATTTLGSAQAKELSTNPEFAALLVRLLNDVGVDPGDRVGVTLSGSFPALGVSVLGALQTMGIEAVLLSSLGASSWGANQAGALWIDYEQWLRQEGGLRYKSRLVTYGGENDNGSSIYSEGIAMMDSSLRGYDSPLYTPGSLVESVIFKSILLENEDIELLINIGGNQASLGGCSHSMEIPPGLHRKLVHCEHENRGVILGMNMKGIPIIQLLNIRELALKHGIQIPYGYSDYQSSILYSDHLVDIKDTLLLLIILLCCVLWIRAAKTE